MKAQIGDIEINFELEGPAGAPVVTLSHSLAATRDLWLFQARAMCGAYRVLRYDVRGHGNSSAPPGAYTMEMLAQDLVGLLDYLKIRRTHFVGISLGGMIGQVFAVNHPDRLEKLVLCDTTAAVPPEMTPVWEERIRIAETEGMSALADQTLERWLSREFREDWSELSEQIRQMIIRTPVAGYVGCARAISAFDIESELPKIGAPTLIMVGENDEACPVSTAETIQKQITGSEMFIVPKALHLSNVEGGFIFNDRLLRFLRQYQ
ncbi:MAG: alpha/beta fold hydrolase [Syntrophobacteraceae bacterium]